MTDTITPTKTYCNCVAMQRGLKPLGYAGGFQDAIVIEAPLPWKLDMTQKAGVLPQEAIDLLNVWLQDYMAGKGYPHLPLIIAPDPEYSHEGYGRVMFYTRKAGMIAKFDKVEYLVPVDKLGKLIWSLYLDRETLPDFEAYRVPEADHIREILVCTHGTVDAACAKFGFPLYKHMRDTYANANLRVWRVSHFGGHVFAPTLMDMPTGHFWAYIGREQAKQLILRDGDVADLYGYYRGWSGMGDSFLQTAESELWQKYGWAWFDYLKFGETVAHDDSDDPQWAEVRIHYRVPDDDRECVADSRVEVSHKIETEHTTGKDTTYAYPQYKIVKTEKLS